MHLLEDMTVEDVMRRWPATMRVFLRHKMHCIGCPISCLHTVAEASCEHSVDTDTFTADLRAAIATGTTGY